MEGLSRGLQEEGDEGGSCPKALTGRCHTGWIRNSQDRGLPSEHLKKFTALLGYNAYIQ